jgi:alpha-galactosidase/6-phospho-beta-glucosidase family protein
MKKLAVIGGGGIHSPVLVQALVRAGLVTDEIFLFDKAASLGGVVRMAQTLVEQQHASLLVRGGQDSIQAVQGADVVLFVLGGGVAGDRFDQRHLAFSGVTGHARSFPKAFRVLNPSLECCAAIARHAPKAKVVVFSNPVSLLCEAIAGSFPDLDVSGICDQSFSIPHRLAKMLGVSLESVELGMFGINHVSFIFDAAIEGKPALAQAIERVMAVRLGDFGFPLPGRLGVMPIGDAYSLFFKGERWRWSQDGIRSTLRFLLHKTSPGAGTLAATRRRRHLQRAIDACKLEVMPALQASAPWIERTIVPFLRLLGGEAGGHYVVTRPNVESAFPVRMAERSFLATHGWFEPLPFRVRIPQVVLDLIGPVAASERLMIQAIRQRSRDLVFTALLAHPNVKDIRAARRFSRRFFPEIS